MEQFFLEAFASHRCGGEDILFNVMALDYKEAENKVMAWLGANAKRLEFLPNKYSLSDASESHSLDTEDVKVLSWDNWG